MNKRIARRLAFSKSRLREIPTPTDGRRAWYYDAKTPGLALAVNANGRKAFYFYRWGNGKPVRLKLGDLHTISVETARRVAAKHNAQIAMGEDPAEERRRRRSGLTLSAAFAKWMVYSKAHKRSWKDDERYFRSYLEPLKHKRLAEIRRTDVQELQMKVARESGQCTSNRMLALLSVIFNKAADWGFEGANPCLGIKRFSERSRDRFLQAEEIPAFLQSVAMEPEPWPDYFLLLLFTGVRKGNLFTMRWDEIDMDRGVWRLPDTKTGLAVVVPLASAAIEILARRKARADLSVPWVFPTTSRRRSKKPHLVEDLAAWRRILQRAGIEGLRPHDLRRSLGSWMAIRGASLPVIGKVLGHTQPQTTSIYARLSVDPQREAVEDATREILRLAAIDGERPQAEAERPGDPGAGERPEQVGEVGSPREG